MWVLDLKLFDWFVDLYMTRFLDKLVLKYPDIKDLLSGLEYEDDKYIAVRDFLYIYTLSDDFSLIHLHYLILGDSEMDEGDITDIISPIAKKLYEKFKEDENTREIIIDMINEYDCEFNNYCCGYSCDYHRIWGSCDDCERGDLYHYVVGYPDPTFKSILIDNYLLSCDIDYEKTNRNDIVDKYLGWDVDVFYECYGIDIYSETLRQDLFDLHEEKLVAILLLHYDGEAIRGFYQDLHKLGLDKSSFRNEFFNIWDDNYFDNLDGILL